MHILHLKYAEVARQHAYNEHMVNKQFFLKTELSDNELKLIEERLAQGYWNTPFRGSRYRVERAKNPKGEEGYVLTLETS